MKKINKSEARKEFNKGTPVYLLPCKAVPESNWCSSYRVQHNKEENNLCQDFDTVVNYFEYYNCGSQTGRYAAFYIEE